MPREEQKGRRVRRNDDSCSNTARSTKTLNLFNQETINHFRMNAVTQPLYLQHCKMKIK
jgi:hypothetical protein